MSELELTDLHKRFGAHAVLSGLDLTVPAGSFTALLGSSGVGKTTLLRLLAGFETPDRGTIAIGGRTVDGEGTHVRPEQRRIGYVPQESSLFPHLTVAGNVAFGLPRPARRDGVGDLLERASRPWAALPSPALGRPAATRCAGSGARGQS
jgi:iron(III) transport system ATP-binding protein